MNIIKVKEVLKTVAEAFGPPGYEEEVRDILRKYFSKMGEIIYDKLGSIVVKIKGKSEGPKILFTAHMDEVGFLVKNITKEGFLKFLPLGGWWAPVVLGSRVIVKNSKGKKFIGVVGTTPPHQMKEEERKRIPQIDDLFIDLGFFKDTDIKKKTGIQLGDPIVPYASYLDFGNGNLLCKAWDDREGCARLIMLGEELKNGDFSGTVYLAGTVQEEVGLRGATTVAELIKPDIAFAFDVSLASDTPGAKPSDHGEKLGGGPGIVIWDKTMVPNRILRDIVVKIAEENDIPYHFTPVPGGYDTGKIHLSNIGVPSLAVGIPTRYIHSSNSILNVDDVVNAVKLFKIFVEKVDQTILKRILSF